MTLKTKSIRFNNITILFAQLSNSFWVVPAKLLGKALGYSKEGGKFIEALSGWGLKPQELITFTGDELAQLKKDAPELGASDLSNSMTLLTLEGVTRSLLRSRSEMAIAFREFFVKNAGDILSDLDQDKLRYAGHKTVRKVKSSKKEQLVLPLSSGIPEALQAPLALLKEMGTTGLFDKMALADMYKGLFDSVAPKVFTLVPPVGAGPLAKREHSTLVQKGATQLVPVSNIQASSMTPNFTSIRSFFLTAGQKHPDYPLWLTAEEIGAKCGKTADQVKTFSSNYARSNGRDLANNQAKAAIIQAGGYFEGVASLVDERKLPIFVDHEIGCLATWYLTDEGMLLWRNYWSPRAVEEILKLVAASPTVRAPALPAPALPLPIQQTAEDAKRDMGEPIPFPALDGKDARRWEGTATLAHPEHVERS